MTSPNPPAVHRTLRLLWLSFMSSVVLLAIVGTVVSGRVDPLVAGPTVRWVVFGACAIDAAATLWLRRAMLLDPMSRGEIDLTTPEGIARYQTVHLLLWALSEAPAVFGFVLCYVAGDRDWATVLFALALILLWINAPRLPEPTEAVGRLAEPEMNG